MSEPRLTMVTTDKQNPKTHNLTRPLESDESDE